jgi:hypothetical protein
VNGKGRRREAWEAIPPYAEVPDEINDDALWDRAREALK